MLRVSSVLLATTAVAILKGGGRLPCFRNSSGASIPLQHPQKINGTHYIAQLRQWPPRFANKPRRLPPSQGICGVHSRWNSFPP